jgi:hypothetical protein
LPQRGDEMPNGVRSKALVCVGEDEDVSACRSDPGIQGGCFAAWLVAKNDGASPVRRRRGCNARQIPRSGVVAPPINGYDNIELLRGVRASKTVGDSGPHACLFIACRDDDRYRRLDIALELDVALWLPVGRRARRRAPASRESRHHERIAEPNGEQGFDGRAGGGGQHASWN